MVRIGTMVPTLVPNLIGYGTPGVDSTPVGRMKALGPVRSYRPDAAYVTTVSGLISVLADEMHPSTSANELIQGTAGSRPQLVTGPAGQPAILCDGVDDDLVGLSAIAGAGVTTVRTLLYGMTTIPSGNSFTICTLYKHGGTNGIIDFFGTQSTSRQEFRHPYGIGVSGAITPTARVYSRTQWVYTEVNEGDGTYFIEDSVGGSGTKSPLVASVDTYESMRIGSTYASGAASLFGRDHVYWIVMWDRILSPADKAVAQAAMSEYLGL